MLKLFTGTCLVISLLVTGSNAETKNKEKICNDKTTVPLDEAIVEETFPKGFFVAMIKKYDVSSPPDSSTPTDKKKQYKYKKCIKATVKTVLGDIEGEGECKYDSVSYLRCTGLGKGGLADMKAFGEAWAIKTDNKTFVVFVGCFDDTDPFWIVLSPKNKLKKPTENIILDHLAGLGFDRADAAPDNDLIRGTKILERKCGAKGTGGSTSPIGTLT